MFGWEWGNRERCGELATESGGLVGTTTLISCVVLQVALGGPGEGVDGEERIPTVIPVKAGRKWRGGS